MVLNVCYSISSPDLFRDSMRHRTHRWRLAYTGYIDVPLSASLSIFGGYSWAAALEVSAVARQMTRLYLFLASLDENLIVCSTICIISKCKSGPHFHSYLL